MEWVNITAKTLPEAIDLALDNLGVDEAEADIEVLEEPQKGLFGRVRGNARVRARVKPKATRPKVERGRNRKRRNDGERSGGSGGNRGRGRGEGNRRGSGGGGRGSGGEGGGGQGDGDGGGERRDRGDRDEGGNRGRSKKGGNRNRSGARGENDGGRDRASDQNGRGGRQQEKAPVEEASMEEVSSHLETFLSGLTEAFGFEGEVSVAADDGGLLGVVDGRHGLMVGPKGRTLDAIQELARVSAQRTTPSSVRIKVDVGGYRELRREALCQFAIDAADEARRDGKERSLEPMSSADRKVIHDALSELAGIETRSAGNEPRRRVVIVPLETVDAEDDADTSADEEAADATAEASGTDADAGAPDASPGDDAQDFDIATEADADAEESSDADAEDGAGESSDADADADDDEADDDEAGASAEQDDGDADEGDSDETDDGSGPDSSADESEAVGS